MSPFIVAHVRQDEAMLVTIFSASNYGAGGNAGAYMVFSLDPALLVLPTTDNSFDAEFLQVARALFHACRHLVCAPFTPFLLWTPRFLLSLWQVPEPFFLPLRFLLYRLPLVVSPPSPLH